MSENFEPDIWVNQRTGERVQARSTIKRIGRSNFEITYIMYLCDLIDKLGSQRFKIFKYILANKDRNNVLLVTTREIAKACDVSTQTVSNALKILKDAGLIKKRTGAIMLLPKVANCGSLGKEEWLMMKFEKFEEPQQGSLLD